MPLLADDLAHKVSGGVIPSALQTLAGAETRRFQRTDALGALSPSFSVAQRALRNLDKSVREGDPSPMWSLLPMHNHFAIAAAFEALDAAGDLDVRQLQTQGRER